MPAFQHIDEAISQAIRLRRYVLPSLLHDAGGVRLEPPDKALFFSTDGWHLFLRVERCAYPIRRHLNETGFETRLPGEFREILDAEADWEQGRIESARAQLEQIGEWALENDAQPIILKGGLAVIETAPLDLNDVDILLPASDGARLFDALLEAGYFPGGTAGRFALNQLWRDGSLAVEIHHGIHDGLLYPPDGHWPGSRRASGQPGLWRLAPLDHLWHVLLHNVDKSPQRRGRIRDLLLMRAALGTCSSAEIARLRDRADNHELSRWLHATLDCVANPDDPAGTAALEEFAVLSYLLGNRPENRSRVYPTEGMVNKWVYALLAGPIERRKIWEEVFVKAPGLSTVGVIRRLQLSAPGVGRAAHILARSIYRFLTLARGCLIANRYRRLRNRYLRHFRDRRPGITAV